MSLSPPLPETPAPAGRLVGAQQRYRRDGATAASPARVVVMAYERLLRDLTDGSRAIAAGDRAESHRALMHAQELVDALDQSLDVERWDGAEGLRAIYQHLNVALVEANVRQDRGRIAHCVDIVTPLLDAWSQATRLVATSGAGEMAGAGS